MERNPFLYGKPISAASRFWGRKNELDHILTRLCSYQPECTALVGERRIGKTSLLNQLRNEQTMQAWLDSWDTILVYEDLQEVDPTITPTFFWGRLLERIALSLQSNDDLRVACEKASTQETINNYTLSNLFARFDRQGFRVIFLFDEFENITNNKNFTEAFFAGLRALAIHHRIGLVTSSNRSLADLCHSDAIKSSPFFNIFSVVRLLQFTEDEAIELIEGSLKETDVSFRRAEIEGVFNIAGYHPFFLQIAGFFLFAGYLQGLPQTQRWEFMANRFAQEAEPHFAYYWHHSEEEEKIVLTALALLEKKGQPPARKFRMDVLTKIHSGSELTLVALYNRGLLHKYANTYSLFSTAFSEWIVNEIIDFTRDKRSFEEWLRASERSLSRLGRKARKDVEAILPQVKAKYRELVIGWLSDPRNFVGAVELLKSALRQ